MHTTNETMTRAETIVKQLGGYGPLRAMTGARDFLATEQGLQFGIGRGAKGGINKVRIDLVGDLYTVTFYKIGRRALDIKVVESLEMVYASDLRRVFTRTTGFELKLV